MATSPLSLNTSTHLPVVYTLGFNLPFSFGIWDLLFDGSES